MNPEILVIFLGIAIIVSSFFELPVKIVRGIFGMFTWKLGSLVPKEEQKIFWTRFGIVDIGLLFVTAGVLLISEILQ